MTTVDLTDHPSSAGGVTSGHVAYVLRTPLGYMRRPYTEYRSVDAQLGSREPRRGLERVG